MLVRILRRIVGAEREDQLNVQSMLAGTHCTYARKTPSRLFDISGTSSRSIFN